MFAFYDKLSIEAYHADYFKKQTQYTPGDHRYIIGKLQVHEHKSETYFLVRVAHRVKVWNKRLQKCKKWGGIGSGQIYYRDEYNVSHHSYVVASISWETSKITEHEAFPDKESAQRALRQYLNIA